MAESWRTSRRLQAFVEGFPEVFVVELQSISGIAEPILVLEAMQQCAIIAAPACTLSGHSGPLPLDRLGESIAYWSLD